MVRYFLRPGGPLWEMMASTLYSSSDPIESRGGVEKLGPCALVCCTGIEGRHGKHRGFSMWEVDRGSRLSGIRLGRFQMGLDIRKPTSCLGIVGGD